MKKNLIRIAVDPSSEYGGKVWFIEYKGCRHYITLVESIDVEFFPFKDRFQYNSQPTEHSIYCGTKLVTNIVVNRTGYITRAYHGNENITEFYLPLEHDFFKYTKIELTAKELFNV